MDGKLIRTRAGDFLNKNFTFDVVFRFKPDNDKDFMVGIGEGAIDNYSVLRPVFALARPRRGGGNRRHGQVFRRGEKEWAKYGDGHPGPHLLRLRKQGDALMMELCVDYKSTFQPTAVHGIPSLHGAAPYLTGKNSFLFIEGDGGTVEQVRLVVEGEAVVSGDAALSVPARVVEGQGVRQAMVKSPAGRRFAADPATAPKGLTVSPAGELAWVPAHDQVGRHEFKVNVTDNTSGNITDKGQATVQTVEIDVVSKEDAAAVGGDLSKVESLYKLELEAEQHQVAAGLGGSVLLLEGDQLRRLDANGLTARQTMRLPHPYGWVGERPGYFVALSDQTKSLDLIDKTKLTVTRSIQMQYLRCNYLRLAPGRPVSLRYGGQGLQRRHRPPDSGGGRGDRRRARAGRLRRHLGAGVARRPATLRRLPRHLQEGERLLMNPDWVGTVPEYGHIDLLIVYDVGGRTLRVAAVKTEAGANGPGLVVSPDGRKLSYLSFVGYPLYTNNVAAWDPTDLTKRPVSYPAKDNKADCKRLAFHPLLPIPAAPAEAGAVLPDRDAGPVQPDRLDFTLPLPSGSKVNELRFSPDGRNLVLDCELAGERFLWRVKLKLSPAEEAVLKNPPKPVALCRARTAGGAAVGGARRRRKRKGGDCRRHGGMPAMSRLILE